MVERLYTANLTGNPFLLFETREVAKGMLKKLHKDEALKEILDSNLFQYKNAKSILKRFNAIYKRLGKLNDDLLVKLAEGTIQEAKITNLFVIVRADRLFREFFIEVVAERIKEPAHKLRERDLRYYFEQKRETVSEVQKWMDKTIKKLYQVYIQILYQSGIIENRKNLALRKFFVNDEFKKALFSSFPQEWIECITV
ncbi:MAG: DUF1819 family protein [Candidatus Omnitrophota bacterium]